MKETEQVMRLPFIVPAVPDRKLSGDANPFRLRKDSRAHRLGRFFRDMILAVSRLISSLALMALAAGLLLFLVWLAFVIMGFPSR